MKTNDRATILVGMGAWTIALIVLLIAQPGAEHRWWLWTCVAGLGLGVLGLLYIRRMNRRGRPAARPGPAEPVETAAGPALEQDPALAQDAARRDPDPRETGQAQPREQRR